MILFINKGVFDLETQLQFLVNELKQHYEFVWENLLSANSIFEASNLIIFNYENNPLKNDKKF